MDIFGDPRALEKRCYTNKNLNPKPCTTTPLIPQIPHRFGPKVGGDQALTGGNWGCSGFRGFEGLDFKGVGFSLGGPPTQ